MRISHPKHCEVTLRYTLCKIDSYIDNYITHLTKNDNRLQYLIQVVVAHKNKFSRAVQLDNKAKSTLNNNIN